MGLVSDLVQIGIPARQAPFLGHTLSYGNALAGVNQATGYSITETITEFNFGVLGVSFCATLPRVLQVSQSVLFVRNDSLITMTLFPAVGEFFNVLAANVGVTIAAGTGLVVTKRDVTNTGWLTF